MASEAVTLEARKKHRKVLRASFTKIANELDTLLKAEGSECSDIEVLWESLRTKFDELHVCENQVYEAFLENAAEEQLIVEMDSSDAYGKRFIELRLRCTKMLQSVAPRVAEDGISVTTENSGHFVQGEVVKGKRKFKLPRIEFKHYNGNIKDWLGFWSQFKKVHEDPDIDNSDKIEYLLQATVPGSRARQLVESFPIIGENYEKIVECMQARFGREDLQIEVHVRELLRLILSNTGSSQKVDISKLYDQIETQLRALDTVGITSDKYAAMLFPLIESCLPQDLLRIWQRSSFSSANINNTCSTTYLTADSTLEVKLKNLMSFLRAEVENEQKICLVSEGFGFGDKGNTGDDQRKRSTTRIISSPSSVTAAGLINTDVAKCIFCEGCHKSDVCFKAQKMTPEEMKTILNEKKACFRCLKVGHQSRKCRTRLKCILCGQSHVPLMCPNLSNIKQQTEESRAQKKEHVEEDKVLSNQTSTHIFLQTLRITLRGVTGSKTVRALIDSGSQRSYILKGTALALGLKAKRSEKIVHCLFGGERSTNNHYCYDILIINGKYTNTIEVLDQPYICNEVVPIFYGPWMEELKGLGVDVSDSKDPGPIEILLGADVAGLLYTGKRHTLTCGLTAIETSLGWTVMGKVVGNKVESNSTMTVLSLFVNPSIAELWQLDVLGIEEPTEKKSKGEMEAAAKDLFLQTVTVDLEGRYQVRLPWLDGHPPLSSNYNIAKKRLATTVRKLEKDNLVASYNEVFREWESLKIIEQVKEDINYGHFLPHRPVLKEGSTTAIRPVFDASAQEAGRPSLNQCLEKGPNLIELIPTLLLRFRMFKIGVISDIKKAFLQISIHQKDRDFLKFLWINEEGQEIVFRHRRVVFGVNCSPFLLGATIEHHLTRCKDNCEYMDSGYSRETLERLLKSFYVDNCIASLPDEHDLNKFVRESILVMAKGEFDLRGWEFSGNSNADDYNVSVLGLRWFTKRDVLTICEDFLKISEETVVTKRTILSMTQKVFDPIGFTAPVTLMPKLLLQSLWEKHISWDTHVDDEIKLVFLDWIADLSHLIKIEIPRWISTGTKNVQDLSIHTFCDASQKAYAAVIFCRVVKDDVVFVHLLAAKSRVAPLKKLTIPRLELMGATIAARLYKHVIYTLGGKFDSFFWSDSSTVIAWIQRNEEWGTFVWNRVVEIRQLTHAIQWRHVPGIYNPADLPSRGCTAKQLLDSKWWEGPRWLYQDKSNWPTENPTVNEEEIAKERKKKLVVTLANTEYSDFWHLSYFSSFIKTTRMIGWIFRYINNVKYPGKKCQSDLTVQDLNEAETFIFKLIQKESFSGLTDKGINCLNPFYDEMGIIRLKSRVSYREDTNDYRFPIILPAKHPCVGCLIMSVHRRSCHMGLQALLSQLREKFWILGGRRTIRTILRKCTICRRFQSKSFVVEPPPLPMDRVQSSVVFETVGVDFAGPLFLKSGEKAWICLFTCAVYRAVHLELTLSLSTAGFLQVLRRFVARRGRPKTIYTDNGTNFKGAENAFENLNWMDITRETSIQRITWRFNPPSAAWWGGFFERMIGMVKQLLRRILGRACLYYEELLTLVCECEAIVNSRPLTYISNDPNDLVALTPAMFLREQAEADMPDCDKIDKDSLTRSARKKQKLREDLRRRFRLEYLGQLKYRIKAKPNKQIKLGDIVLIENDNVKRIAWPLGRIIELIQGQDGQTRLVRVKTARGELLRPVQRLFPLECEDEVVAVHEPNREECEDEAGDRVPKPGEKQRKESPGQRSGVRQEEDSVFSAGVSKSRVPDQKVNFTRSGRLIKLPNRYSD